LAFDPEVDDICGKNFLRKASAHEGYKQGSCGSTYYVALYAASFMPQGALASDAATYVIAN